MQTVEIKAVRNEADLYGYSVWLTEYLGLDIYPRALRGFQHGWIWWDMVEGSDQGLDPNIDPYWGLLVQDAHVEKCMRNRKIFAKACGLPFLNYIQFSEARDVFKREGGLLYVPTHSNPWSDVAEDIIKSSIKFSKKHPDSSIMLSWSDRKLADLVRPYFRKVEIGAGALEMTSFPRMAGIFLTYDQMVTDAIGSHVLYAISCGMKVGIDAELYYDAAQTDAVKRTEDWELAMRRKHDFSYSTLEYLDKRFSKMVIDGEGPTYCTMPEFPVVEPKKIAQLLGWDITYECEIVKV